MDVYIDDETFVRAPVPLVYDHLVDLTSYPAWWQGFTVLGGTPPATSPTTGSHAGEMPGRRWDAECEDPHPLLGSPRKPGASRLDALVRCGRRRLRLVLRPYGFRPEQGMFLDVSGDLAGTAEWWLAPGHGGVVVHHLARCDTRLRRPQAVAAGYRQAVREALWGLKDRVQSRVRERAGYAP